MSTPQWSPVDDDTADLLTALAEPHPVIGADVPGLFLAACQHDAMAHGGLVSVNRVSAALADSGIEHHRYSALWSHFTGRDKPMRRAVETDTPMPWETRRGSRTGNDGKPMRLRVWTGGE